MRPKRDPLPRAKEAWWWLGGILTLGVVGAGVVAAGVALWENIDVRQLTPGLVVDEPPLPEPNAPDRAARAAVTFTAALFESEANADYFEDESYYATEIARWRRLAEDVGGRVRSIDGLAGLRSVDSGELLIIPESPCLSSQELAALAAHVDGGGHIVANWALGVRDEACEWRGWGPLLDVTGAEDIREIPRREGLFLTVPAGLPTAQGLDAGSRIELKPDPSLALRMEGQRVYWSDWALNPAPDADGGGADVAVSTTATPAGGRVAWFGLRSRQAATPGDSLRLDRMIRNGLSWAAGVPSAAPSAWPGAARSALVFALEVEGAETWVNARDAAAAFELDGTPITFFVVSGLVEEDPSLAAALVEAGEVGTQTVQHAPLRGQTRQEQRMRLLRSFDHLVDWSGVEPGGLRPPEEAYDSVTLRSWKAAGGTYLLSANEARSASPEIHETTEGDVVLLPRLLKDDYSVIVRDVTLRSERLADAYRTGIAKMRAIGGLAAVVGHTQIITAGPRLEAFRSVARTAREEEGWWVAEAREVAEWWLLRGELELEWRSAGVAPPGMARTVEHELVLSAPAEQSVDGVWIDVVLPTGPAGLPLVDGVPVDHIVEPWGMRVSVGPLDPAATRIVSWASVSGQDGP
ncbi:MAG: polysaccharide deacetylase family protein [Gemmatimonadota bacterium]